MITQSETQIVQWQDFTVVSEVDIVFGIAQQHGWQDCKFFGHGDMLTQPLQSHGWKLIPADLYEYSIPAKGVDRLLKIIDAGVHIQGVVIADDTRRINRPDAFTNLVKSLPSAKTVYSAMGKVLFGLMVLAGVVLLGWILVKAFTVVVPLLFFLLIGFSYDPQLIILVDDGKGGMAWISVMTWFD